MVTALTLLLSFVNFILILGIIIYYLCTHYVIISKETWDTISEFVVQHQEEEFQEPTEPPGGSGFFKEYVEEEEDED